MKIKIRKSIQEDINDMVSLSRNKRLAYEKAQPKFWRYAGTGGDAKQAEWFQTLLNNKDYIMLTAEDSDEKIVGFLIGKVFPAPEVYNPGGLTLMIDDFCVISSDLWHEIGFELINSIRAEAKAIGVSQIVVVCGAHDEKKRMFLKDQGLSIASEWFVGAI